MGALRTAVCGMLVAGAARSAPGGNGAGELHRAVIAWNPRAAGADSLDQLSLEAVFGALGLPSERARPEEIARADPDAGALVVIPHASAARMSAETARALVAKVETGLVLLTDGPSPLSRMLGIRSGGAIGVSGVEDRMNPEIPLLWPGHQRAAWIASYPGGADVVYAAREENRPLGLVLKRGGGTCLVFAPLVDPATGDGYSRFPTLPEVLRRALGCRGLLSRRSADAYFDPGYRVGRTAEALARMWRSWGITAIHVAAWYARGPYTFDYAGLIGALHRNGILAYAWLEWPYVGRGFWDSHPSWRQKNALLQDAHLDFLYLMDLQNPECMAGAIGELEELLALDWDGVDVAEFTLTGAGREALEGPAMPEFFTGFTDTGRREFSKAHGFDPLELFDVRSPHYWKSDRGGLKTFYRYRTSVNLETERSLFSALARADRGAGRSRETMLTIVDNTLHPEFDDLLGFDMNATVGIAREFGLTLDVEDPYTEWSSPPERYTAMHGTYRSLLGGHPYIFDVNVVPLEEDRKPHFSTAQATGTEFLELAQRASGQSGRVCFYCESSVYEKDWRLLPGAMAGSGRVTEDPVSTTVDAPYTVTLRSGHADRGVWMDGAPWPAQSDSEITVPAGSHRIRIAGTTGAGGIRLLSIAGELTGARWGGDSLIIGYRSQGRCALEFDAVPGVILLDGKPSSLSRSIAGRSCVIIAPPGSHDLTLPGR